MTALYYEDQEMKLSDFVNDSWDDILEEEWGSIVVEHLDPETEKLLEEF